MSHMRRILWVLCSGAILCTALFPYGNHGQLTDKSLRAKREIYQNQGATDWLNDLNFYRRRIRDGSADEDYLLQKQLEQMSPAERQQFIDTWLSSLSFLEQIFYRGLIDQSGIDSAIDVADGLSTSSRFWNPYTKI